MLISNWLSALVSRIRRRPRYNSRARRTIRKRWQAVQQNRLTTVDSLEERTMLTGFDPEGTPFANHSDHSFSSQTTIDGDYMVVTNPINDVAPIADNVGAYVYVRNENGTPSDSTDDTWEYQSELILPSLDSSESITSTDISGDTIVIGVGFDDVHGETRGSVYVYTRSGATWSQQAELTPNSEDANDYDLFGVSVSISGDTIFVGAPGDDEYGEDAGAVYVYTRTGSTWNETQKITTSDYEYYTPYPHHYESIDFASYIKVDGDTLVASNTNNGTLSIFTQQGGIWGGETFLAPAHGLSGSSNLIFGGSVFDIDDDTIVAQSNGSATVFTKTENEWQQLLLELPQENDTVINGTPWYWNTTIDAVAISGETIAIKTREGHIRDWGDIVPPNPQVTTDRFVHIYQLTDGTWTLSQSIPVERDEAYTFYNHDINVALDGNTLVADDRFFNSINSGIAISDAMVIEGDTGTQNLTFTITRSGEIPGDLNEEVSVAYKTIAGGTSIVGLDYPEVDLTTISFAADPTATVQTQQISIPIYGDHETEFEETVFVELLPVTPGSYISDTIGIGTIQNDDVGISIGDVVVTEGDAGSTQFITLNVTRGGDLSQSASVEYFISAGSAENGVDYTATNSTGTINFTADSQSNFQYETITIEIIGDDRVELDETITVTIQNSSSTPISKSSAIATIVDNDSASITIDDITVLEGAGQAVFTVTLDQDVELDADITVDFLVGSPQYRPLVYDYIPNYLFFETSNNSPVQTGQLTFTGDANEKKYIVVDIIDNDSVVEALYEYQVTIDNLQAHGRNIELAGNSDAEGSIYGLGKINNDDIASFIVGDAPPVYEGETATFTVTLDSEITLQEGQEITVSYYIDSTTPSLGMVNGTPYGGFEPLPGGLLGATPGPTNRIASGTLTFNGTLNEQKIINVAIPDDDLISFDKDLTFRLVNIQRTSGLLNQRDAPLIQVANEGTGTILNDDAGFFAPYYGEEIIEGDDGEDKSVTFSVLRAGKDAGDLNSVATIDYRTLGSNSSLHEVIAPPATLTFTADPTARFQILTFTVDVYGDNVVDGPDYLGIRYENPSTNLVIHESVYGLTDITFGIINDNDSTALSVSDVIVHEDGTATVTVTQDQTEVVEPFNVRLITYGGNAQPGVDYISLYETIEFSGAAGESHSFNVTLINDLQEEFNEEFFGSLGLEITGWNIYFDSSPVKITIIDDDAPQVSIGDAQVDEDNLTISFDVTVNKALGSAFTVDYTTASLSAVDGTDFTGESGTLSFTGLQANETKTITIDLIDDSLVELQETFSVLLSNLDAGGAIINFSDAEAIGTIDNEDSGFVIDDWSITESNAGTTQTVTFTVIRDGDLSQAASIDYAISGTASAGTDFTGATTATLNFVADAMAEYQEQTISIVINGDTLVEADETVLVTLQNASVGVIVKASGTGTILNDETASLVINDVTVNEETGLAQFEVILDKDVQGNVTVDFETLDSTALSSNSDYDYSTGTVTFAGGTAGTQFVSITINDDTAVEGDEEFLVRLLDGTISAGGAYVVFEDQEAVGQISNTDAATVSITNVTETETYGGTNNFEFEVTLSNAVDINVGLKAITQNGDASPGSTTLGSALAGQDYTAISQDITFLAGEVSKTVIVNIDDDNIVELDEMFYVQLQNLFSLDDRKVIFAGGEITERATGTISNDDTAEISVSYNSNSLILEDDLGQSSYHKFDLELSKVVDSSVTVDVNSLIGLSATEGLDYDWYRSYVTFQAGQTIATAYALVYGDDLFEGDHDGYLKGAYETFGIELSNVEAQSRNVIFSNSSATAKIYDDEHIDDTKFNILIDYDASLVNATAAKTAMDAAIARWESIIDTDLGNNRFYRIAENQEIIYFDDLLITVKQEYIDGSGFTLAQANPAYIRNDSKLPYLGEITIDSSDINNSGLTDILTHEIAHALGFGSLWEYVGLFDPNNPNALYTGVNATIEYEALLAQAGRPSENYVGVPVANTGGAGTSGGHWRESVFDTELLTGFYNSGVANPISRVSIAAFEDLGYEVDYAQADSYSLPANPPSGGTSFGSSGESFSVFSALSLGASEGAIGITVDDISAQEDGVYEFTVSLSAAADEEITVRANTVLGTAGVSDFTSIADQLITFAAGETTKTITVIVNDDTVLENDETFSLVLSNATYNGVTDPEHVLIIDDTGVAMIENNDSASLLINDVIVNESDSTATFTVTLDNAVDTALTVDFYSADSTATTAGNDYVFESGVLHFNGTAGETVTFTVQINEDSEHEFNESFMIDLSHVMAGGRNVTLSDAQGVATIIDNDSPRLSISDAVVNENAGTATFAVTLDKDVSNSFTVDFATADNYAVAGTDYVANNGTLNFAGTAGETQTITITINEDTVAELDESFLVNLSNVQAAPSIVNLTDSQGLGTILGNDTGTAGDDDFLLRMNADGVTVELLNNLSLVDSRLLSDLIMINIDGGAGDDTLTLDLSNGLPFPVGAINFSGGANAISGDSLSITQGSYAGTFGNITHTFTSNSDGSLDIDGQIINYTGLEPIFDDLIASNRVFDFTGAAETITLSDDGTANDGLSLIDSTLGESVVFAAATSTTTILTSNGTGADVINVTGLDSLNASDVTIIGDSDDDVTFLTNTTAMGTSDLTVTGQTITVNSGISSTGGAISLTASLNILLNTGSSLTTVDGGLTLLANNGGTAAGTFVGIAATNATVQTTGTGNILFNSSGENGEGIYLYNGTSISSTATGVSAGTITLDGTAGTGAAYQHGILLIDASIESVDGAISLTGQGGGDGTGDDNVGLYLYDSSISSTGTGTYAATITLDGTGGDGIGIIRGIRTNLLSLTSTDGDISITGVGQGDAAGSDNEGIVLGTDTTISSTGTGADAADISIHGTAGAGALYNQGIYASSQANTSSIVGGISVVSDGNFWISTDSSITSTSGDIEVDVNYLSASNVGTLSMNNTTSFITGSGDIDLDAAGDISITRLSTTGTVTIDSTSGSILDNDDTYIDIIAGTAALAAAGSIGTVGNPLTAQMDSHTAVSGTSDVNINNRELFSISDASVNEDGTFSFTVSIDHATDQNVTVLASTAYGTAGAGDLTSISNQLVTIVAGQTSAIVTVNVTDDSVLENDETFTVLLSDPKYNGATNSARITIGDGTGAGTILNDDTVKIIDNGDTGFSQTGTWITAGGNPAFYQSDYSYVDGIGGTGQNTSSWGFTDLAAGRYRISGTWSNDPLGASNMPITISGVAGGDVNMTVSQRGVIQDVYDDGVYWQDLGFFEVDGNGVITITISDDQADGYVLAEGYRLEKYDSVLSIADVSVSEDDGTATFTVTSSLAVGSAFTVDFATVDGTAIAGSDYTATSGTLNFAGTTAGETQTITVALTDDATAEQLESFLVNLSNAQHPSANVVIANQGQATIAGNDSPIVTIDGTVAADEFQMQMNVDGVTLEIWSGSTLIHSGLLANITEININGGAGVDILTVDLSNGLPFPSGTINFDGEADGGSIVLESGSYAGSVTTISHALSSNSAGSMSIDGQVINYTNAETVSDYLDVTNRVFDFLSAAETITLNDTGTSNDGLSSIDSTLGAAVTFVNTATVTVSTNSGSGADTVSIEGLDSLNLESLTVTGDTGDEVRFQTNDTDLGTSNLTVTAQTITVVSNVSATSGAISLTASRNIFLADGSGLTTVDGGITLLANDGGSTTGQFVGVKSNNTTIATTGSGDISITGYGADGTDDNNYGINLVSSAISSSSTSVDAGTITINGTGGAGTQWTSGLRFNLSTLSSIEGDITLIGQGGSGSLSESDGVILGATAITIANANLDINGQAGGTSGSSTNFGVSLKNLASITSTGTGTISIAGDGGEGTSYNTGIVLSASEIESYYGDISLTGQGGQGTDTNNIGIFVLSASSITSLGTGATAATINLDGTGGAGNHDSRGIFFRDSDISSIDGNISLIGQGSTSVTGSWSQGVVFADAYINSNGTSLDAAEIYIHGTGGTGVAYNDGIAVYTHTEFTSKVADISFTSDGSVLFYDNTRVESTTGDLEFTSNYLSGNSTGVVLMDTGTVFKSIQGDINIDAYSDTSLTSLIAGGTVTVDSTIGSILDNGDVRSEIFATTAVLNAYGSVGTSGNPLEANVVNLSGVGTTSGFYVNNSAYKQIIDNGDTEYSATTAEWGTFSNSAYYQGDTQYLSAGAHPDATASWKFDDLIAGTYRVSGFWNTGANRATNTEFTVSGIEGGSDSQIINQQNRTTNVTDAGFNWQDLGFFTVDENGSITVTMTNELADGLVIADAMRLENVGSPVSVNDVSVDEDAGTATFTVTLGEAVQGGLSVDWSTADGTATAGSDYTAGSGTLNFTGTAGETQTITVTLTDEYVIESDETFLVNLSNLVTSGNAVIADPQGVATIIDDEISITIAGTAAADDFQVQLNADGVTLEVWNDTTLVFSDLLTEVTELNINGGAGADTFTVDLSNGLPFPVGNINFDGEADGGSIVLESGSYAGFLATITHTLNSDTAGSILIDGQVINYTNAETVSDYLDVTNRVFDFLSAAETITLTDSGTSNDGLSSIDSTLGAAVTFVSAAAVTISSTSGSGVDQINVQGLDSLNAGSFTVTGDANDNVTFQSNNTEMGVNDLTVTAQTITVDSAVSSTDGEISLTASRNILLNAGSSLTTVDGGITLLANDGGTTAGDFKGIFADNTTIQSSGTGNISITGYGGAGTGNSNLGFDTNYAVISSTGTGANAGTITIDGTGGGGGAAYERGLYLQRSTVTSIDGDITLLGQGGGNGTSYHNQGVRLYDATVTSTGISVDAAEINIHGSGGNGTLSNDGLLVTNESVISSIVTDISIISEGNVWFYDNSRVESSTGDLEFTANYQGGTNTGVFYMNTGTVFYSGAGNIDIDAYSDTYLTSLIAGGTVTVDSTIGSILDNGDVRSEIFATTAVLNAYGSVGTSGNPLEANVVNLSGVGTTSGFYVNNSAYKQIIDDGDSGFSTSGSGWTYSS
ncbi:Calx-beta domain-containing protein, partial [uncultured Gimesia sp.]|uniref:Calx-beta domain-containing protein n=1 Tax=uncultured Gimesia sp. TaxID=1678688 RepID=UPI0030DC97EA